MPDPVVFEMRNDDGDLLRIHFDDEAKEIISQEVIQESERTQIRNTLRAARARVLHAVVAGRLDFVRGTPGLIELRAQVKLLTLAVSILIMKDLDIGDADVTPDTVAVRVGIPTRRPGAVTVPARTVAATVGVPAQGMPTSATVTPATVAATVTVIAPGLSTEGGA